MNNKSKIATTLAALALTTSLIVPTSAANAGHKGWGIAAGVIGGAIVAGAVANAYAQPVYAAGYRRCFWERQYDSYGFYIGSARICRVVY